MDNNQMTSLMPERRIYNAEKTKKLPCCKGRKKPQPWVEGTLNSEYRNQFIEKEVPTDYAQKPKATVKPNAKFDGMTTNKADYVPFQVGREQMIKPVHSQAVEGLPFSGTSAYASEYGPKEVAYQRVKPSNAFEPNKGEFYGTTTHKQDFQENQVPVAARIIMQPNSLKTGGHPFEGNSIYKDNFTKHVAVPREMVKRAEQPLAKGKFEGDTMYNTSYIPKEVCVPEQFRPQDARPMSRGGWYGGIPSTEYGGQFLNKETPYAEPVKPVKGGELWKGAFDGTTTNKADYVQYSTPMKDRMIKPSHAIESEKLPFTGQSTYQGQYIPKDVPYARVKPNNAFQPNKAPFDASTTHKAAFADYGVVPSYRGKPQRSTFGKESKPFEGESTYKTNFSKMPQVPREKVKVLQAQALRTGPFDGTTTYKVDYVEKEIPERGPDCRECDSCEEDEGGW